MKNSVYCIASKESLANDILQHLRNLGFTSSDVSVLLKTKDTKNITVEEDAIRDAEKGSLVGGALGIIGLADTRRITGNPETRDQTG